jgi:hypothetical protein
VSNNGYNKKNLECYNKNNESNNGYNKKNLDCFNENNDNNNEAKFNKKYRQFHQFNLLHQYHI